MQEHLANDQIGHRTDVNAASEGEAAGKRPDNPVSGASLVPMPSAEVPKPAYQVEQTLQQ